MIENLLSYMYAKNCLKRALFDKVIANIKRCSLFWLTLYIDATWRIQLSRPYTAAMRPYVKLLWPLSLSLSSKNAPSIKGPSFYFAVCHDITVGASNNRLKQPAFKSDALSWFLFVCRITIVSIVCTQYFCYNVFPARVAYPINNGCKPPLTYR